MRRLSVVKRTTYNTLPASTTSHKNRQLREKKKHRVSQPGPDTVHLVKLGLRDTQNLPVCSSRAVLAMWSVRQFLDDLRVCPGNVHTATKARRSFALTGISAFGAFEAAMISCSSESKALGSGAINVCSPLQA